MLKRIVLRTAVIAAALLIGQAFAADTKPIDVPAGDLAGALETLAKQSGVEFVYEVQQLKGLRTKGVHGELTPESAVAKLLEGTKLTITTHQSGAVLIAAPAASSAAAREPIALRLAQSEAESTQKAANAENPESKNSSSAADSSAEKTDSSKIEEVVVTAQRREQKLKDVPISMTVFTGKELDMSTETSVNDTLFSVPGLNVTTDTIGGVARITIRGVNALLGSSTVGYYIDGVPFGFVGLAFSPDPGPFDLDRVEVLRGPQGTLYGASSFNGVVRILTNDANLDDHEFKARTLVSSVDGGGQNFGANGVVNLPLVPGKLAARLMVSYDHLGGYVDNLVADEINDGEITSARFKINAQPTEDLSVQLGYWGSRSEIGSLPMSLPGTDFYPGDLNPGKNDDFDVSSATVSYDFGSFTATNTTSYIDYFNQSIVDWSAWSNTGIIPGLDGLFYYEQVSKVFTNEFSLTSDSDGPWTWTAGAIYRDGDDSITNHWNHPVLGPITFVPNQNQSTSYAVFGELTRSFANGALELTGGLRYFHDKVHQSEPGGTYDVTSNFDHVSPRLVLTWHADDDMTVYASYAQGFRSGLNQPANTAALFPDLAPLQEDTLDNFEIGSKGNLFEDFLSYEVAAYYIRWDSVQQILCHPIILSGVPTCANNYVNAKTAAGPGVDVGLTLHLSEQLGIGLSGSWNDLHFTEDVFYGSDVLYPDGTRLTLSPEYTLGGSLSYNAPLGDAGLEWGLMGSVDYKPATFAPFVGGGGASGNPITSAKLGVHITNPDVWTFEIFSDNILNERGVAVPSNDPNNFYVTRWVPRTIGAQFSVHF